MTDREYFIKLLKDELPRFERVFEALPTEQLNWRPHDRSKSAIELATSMAFEAGTYPIILKTGKLEFSEVPQPDATDVKGLSAHFKKFLEEGSRIASGMTDDEWASPAVMSSGGHSEWETTRGEMVWGMLLDLIHHRGQLSVYVRPMGGKVPSIYGPSADTQ